MVTASIARLLTTRFFPRLLYYHDNRCLVCYSSIRILILVLDTDRVAVFALHLFVDIDTVSLRVAAGLQKLYQVHQ